MASGSARAAAIAAQLEDGLDDLLAAPVAA
jgi:hypothetical protein